MNHKISVIIIEDEKSICSFIETALLSEGYRTFTASTGSDGLSLITCQCPDIVLLDLGLPDMDGIDVLKQIRLFSKIPVLVLSARTREQDKVEALDIGADDYITKPFGTSELMARIRTALRHQQSGTSGQESIYQCNELTIYFDKRRILLRGEEIHLTQNEYKLVSLLARQSGRVLTYDYLMNQIWGPFNDGNNQILRVNMAHIRRKLEQNPAAPEYIFTEIGVGYRMKESEI